ncbi:hypothetical protein N658DRAFT_517766 [Parathielavia hyrcaniae]|uniref:BHLH domain-containing protein n=1 Tax=Parathielavia hyrcaniae TaxID=113614 RepID=A0AAN6PVM1_9PEZI|nr:hypothetical protein N658DRAFT_517766 [Parathielavia hyrcaniae]
MSSAALVDEYAPSWPSPQEHGQGGCFGGYFANAQQHGPIPNYGLPSPAPTATAVSPQEWSGHDLSTITGAWTPVSPLSPSAVRVGGEMFNRQFEGMPCASATTRSPTLDGGPQSWVANAGHDRFNNAYLGYDTATSLPHNAGVCVSIQAPWTGGMAFSSLPDDSISQVGFAVPQQHSASDWNKTKTPQVLPERPFQADRPYSSPYSSNASPGPLSSRPKRSKPQAQPASNAPDTIFHHDPVPPTTTTTTTPTTSSTKTKERNNTPPEPASNTKTGTTKASSTLRTAARRTKRPAPSLAKPGESPERQRARTNHNMVEQQYRHRLHAQFEALLEVLPERMLDNGPGEEQGHAGGKGDTILMERGGGGGGEGGGGGGKGGGGKRRRRMSKVDVLKRAARAIRDLEGNIELVRREVEGLRRERDAVLGMPGRM